MAFWLPVRTWPDARGGDWHDHLFQAEKMVVRTACPFNVSRFIRFHHAGA